MVECPTCHTSNPPDSRLCSKCSTPFGIDSATLVVDTSPPPHDPDATQVFSDVSMAATLAGGATGWSVAARSVSSDPNAALEEGTLLGERYEILKRLGEGGMGAVYKARDHELDRLVALKVIRPELAGHPDILRRFKQELILARQVTHKNVVRIFDLGSADGRKFITMDYIEGRDLKSILADRGRLPPSEVVPILQQVCRGLEAAHAEGVVHRDLKPQNIMVDDSGRVWLMDFGLARSMELAGLTRTGVLMGTPDYMSPEQARAEKVDVRSDLFSLGIIAYELLSGELPFQADTLMAKLLKRVQQKAKPVTDLDASIPAALAAVVMKCLEPDVKQRYQTVREILDDLSGAGPSQMTSAGQSTVVSAFPTVSLDALGPGADFGPRYHIESEIGEGGMGRVYKAHDNDLDRMVALKLVRPELAGDANSLQRFKQELLLASRISHRNILRIHDLGDVGGIKFISMAYIQGMDLHELLEKTGKLQTERVVNIAKQLAGALEAAHAEGVVHRDLKPRNVLIDVDDHVYVSDFGLAKSLDAETTAMTRAGEVLGTPRYMSPEQAESKPADHRSDLYSLGVILYEMATGDAPFTADSSLQVMFQHVQQAPKDPRQVNPETPEYLASIILKCLEKDPANRYQSATELLRDLESGTPPTRIVRLRIAETAYPKWLFAVTGLVLLIGIGLAIRPVRERVFGRSNAITSEQLAAGAGTYVAVAPLRVQGADPRLKYQAEGIVDALSSKLDQMKSVHLAARDAAEHVDSSAPAANLARRLGSKLVLQGVMQGAGDKIDAVLTLNDASGKQLWTKDFSGLGQDLLTIEDQIYNDVVTALELKPSDEELARNALRPTESIAAYELYLKGRDMLQGTPDEKNVRAAIDSFDDATKKDASFAQAYAALGNASLMMYQLTRDGEWAQKALSAAQHAQTLNDEVPEVHLALANVYRATNKTTEAIVELQRLLQLEPNSVEATRLLAETYLAAGRKDEALRTYQQAVDANPNYAPNYVRLGAALFQLGQTDKALAALRRAVELAPDSALAYRNIGLVDMQGGKWNDAIAMFQKAVALNPDDFIDAGNLASAYHRSGDAAKAAAAYQQAATLANKAVQANPKDAQNLGYLALYSAQTGDIKRGLEMMRRARAVEPDNRELLYQQTVVNAVAGQEGDAMESLKEALQKGYPALLIKNDPELAPLAKNPAFESLLVQYASK